MDHGYHRRPLSQAEDESDDDGNPFNADLDPNASTDRIPLTQGMQRPVPPFSASPRPPRTPPYDDRPTSRYTLSESYVPGAQPPPFGAGFGPGVDPTGGRPLSVMSNMTEDWIQRQQPVLASQADLRRYQTRRVRLNQGNVFSAEYPYAHLQFLLILLVFLALSKMPLSQSGEIPSLVHWNSHICAVCSLGSFPFTYSRHRCNV